LMCSAVYISLIDCVQIACCCHHHLVCPTIRKVIIVSGSESRHSQPFGQRKYSLFVD
jgi:hypothetical protein